MIKTFSEDDIHRSVKNGIWSGADSGNRRLDAVWMESVRNNNGKGKDKKEGKGGREKKEGKDGKDAKEIKEGKGGKLGWTSTRTQIVFFMVLAGCALWCAKELKESKE